MTEVKCPLITKEQSELLSKFHARQKPDDFVTLFEFVNDNGQASIFNYLTKMKDGAYML